MNRIAPALICLCFCAGVLCIAGLVFCGAWQAAPERVFVCPDPAYNSDANYTDDGCPVEAYQLDCEWRILR